MMKIRRLWDLFKPKIMLPVPETQKVASAYRGDGPGVFGRFDKEVKAWCEQNLNHAYGVKARWAYDQTYAVRFTCWFTDARDAVLFKLRWL